MTSLNDVLTHNTSHEIDFVTEKELQDFGTICEEIGISAKEVLSYIVRKTIKDKSLPFRLEGDIFYSTSNYEYCLSRANAVQNGHSNLVSVKEFLGK